MCEERKAYKCLRQNKSHTSPCQSFSKELSRLTRPAVVGPVLGPKLLGVAPFLKDEWDTGGVAAAGGAAVLGVARLWGTRVTCGKVGAPLSKSCALLLSGSL